MAAAGPATASSWGRDALAEPAPRPAASPPPSPPRDGLTYTNEDFAPQRARLPRKGRRVKRIVRRVELWSVLKLALSFFLCMYVVGLVSIAVLWAFANSAGLVDNFESFANDVGWENWQFNGEQMFQQAALIGAVLVVTATLMTVLATALLNVISELTGGIRIVVIEEDVTPPEPAVVEPGPVAPIEGPKARRG
jgi:hypothetical protein